MTDTFEGPTPLGTCLESLERPFTFGSLQITSKENLVGKAIATSGIGGDVASNAIFGVERTLALI